LETKETSGVSTVVDQADNSNVKSRIFEYAMPLFKQGGFARVTVEDITSGLGMSKKTFYKFFESKEDLVHQVVLRITGEVSTNIEVIIHADQPFVTRLHSLVTMVHSRFSCLSTTFLRDIQIHSPASWTYIQEFRRTKILAVWGGLIEQGKREGFIRADINSRLLLLSMIGIVESVVNPQTLAEESFSTEVAIRGIINMLFRGILTDAAVQQLDSLQLPQLS
jgi:AcrR family transcriptional regulator